MECGKLVFGKLGSEDREGGAVVGLWGAGGQVNGGVGQVGGGAGMWVVIW